MSFFKKSIGFLASFAVFPAVFAATARPSIITTASSRMPTMTAAIYGNSVITTTGTATTTTIADKDCIDSYTECAKGGDVCGSSFEECTNKTLFFAKKANCASVLFQCKTTGIASLFGTSNTAAFATKNSAGEYTYPTDGSVLGQLITSGLINNRYDTATCVKKYTGCLKKDDVCGSDFELCTTNTEFKKQKLFCESTLGRCQDEGKTELFGSTATTANPTATSRLGVMISEGAALAAVNAVATCYKIADQCILNTCATNPYKCKEGSDQELVNIVETINNPDGTTTTTTTSQSVGAINRNQISGFIKNNCFDTIGANKYCYATFVGNGAMPTNAQLKDEDNKDTIFGDAYSSRMNDAMKTKIDDLIAKFETKTKGRCSSTIASCAMNTCGQGSGAACYASAFSSSNTIKGVTNPNTLADIKYGCEAIVNNDTSCKYAGATFRSTTGVLDYATTSLFDLLFTSPDDTTATKPDAVGAVATLNSKLSTSYNQSSLDKMKKQCQTVATGCVKSMCGNDYENCYRNRTDVYSVLTNSGDTKFDKSMNKVGGVLDHTIVLGLCLNTVKNNPVCEEHIKAESARRTASVSTADSWGSGITDTRSGWLDAGTMSATSSGNIQDSDADGNLLCTTADNNGGNSGRCDDATGAYIYPKMVSENAYNIAQAERSVFRDLVYDLEVEAQAKYNAKLTKQQNSCLSENSGGIVGAGDLGSTFMWVKLKGKKVPTNYAVKGLTNDQIVSSNDLYGSFCRVRVTLQSDDKYVQDAISAGNTWGTAYYAAGDSFTCGSWIPNSALEEISNVVGGKAADKERADDARSRNWITLGGAVLGGVGGGIGANYLQKTGLGGLLGTTNKTDNSADQVSMCKKYAASYKSTTDAAVAKSYGDLAIKAAEEITKDSKESKIDTSVVKKTIEQAAKKDATTAADDKKNADIAMDALSQQCEVYSNSAAKPHSKTIGNLIGVGAGSVIGGVLAYQATKSVQEASADKAENEARDAWMNEVGSHIRCYIGSEEVGSYGDIISTEME